MGGFIKKILDIEPQVFEAPKVADVPSFDDAERELEQRNLLKEQERKRKGRRSTILTGSQGLNEIADENINQKTLLGG